MGDEVAIAARSKSLYDLGNPSIAKQFWAQPAAAKVVLFHADWCGYCKSPRSALCALAPPRGAPTTILFGLVESAVKAPVEIMTGVTATGFPTMVLFGANNQRISTMRARDARGIVSELDATVPSAMAHPSMQYIRSVRTGGGSTVPCMTNGGARARSHLAPWKAAVEQARSDASRKDSEQAAAVQPQFFSRTYPEGAPLFDGRVGGHIPAEPLFREGPQTQQSLSSKAQLQKSRSGGTNVPAIPSGGTEDVKATAAAESQVRAALLSAHGQVPERIAPSSTSTSTNFDAQHLAVWRARRAARAAGARAAQLRANQEANKSEQGSCTIM